MDDLDFDNVGAGSSAGGATSAGDEDVHLPKATIHKLISEHLPPNVLCTRETKDLISDCCVEFIHLIASEATEVCEKTKKKTINGEHIVAALQNLGFGEYVEELNKEISVHKQQQKERGTKKASRFGNASGLSEEELLRQQEELFKAARDKLEQRRLEEHQQLAQASPSISHIIATPIPSATPTSLSRAQMIDPLDALEDEQDDEFAGEERG